MAKHLNTPQHNRQCEGNTHLNQLQTIFQFLQKEVATASMVSDATGIYQKNICRYKRDLERAGRLWEIEKSYVKRQALKRGI